MLSKKINSLRWSNLVKILITTYQSCWLSSQKLMCVHFFMYPSCFIFIFMLHWLTQMDPNRIHTKKTPRVNRKKILKRNWRTLKNNVTFRIIRTNVNEIFSLKRILKFWSIGFKMLYLFTRKVTDFRSKLLNCQLLDIFIIFLVSFFFDLSRRQQI